MPLGKREKAIKRTSDSKQALQTTQKSTFSSKSHSSQGSNSNIQFNQTTGGIVKTVILPYDQINNLKNELEYLK